MDYLCATLSFAMLVVGSNFLLRSAVGLSIRLRLSRIVIGMTVVSWLLLHLNLW